MNKTVCSSVVPTKTEKYISFVNYHNRHSHVILESAALKMITVCCLSLCQLSPKHLMRLTSHNAVLKVLAEVKVFRYSCHHIHERIIDQVLHFLKSLK